MSQSDSSKIAKESAKVFNGIERLGDLVFSGTKAKVICNEMRPLTPSRELNMVGTWDKVKRRPCKQGLWLSMKSIPRSI